MIFSRTSHAACFVNFLQPIFLFQVSISLTTLSFKRTLLSLSSCSSHAGVCLRSTALCPGAGLCGTWFKATESVQWHCRRVCRAWALTQFQSLEQQGDVGLSSVVFSFFFFPPSLLSFSPVLFVCFSPLCLSP